MELIDKEELLRRLDKMINFERRQVKLTDAWNTLLRARDTVLECKVVDAEPVKHGRWDDSLDGITPYCTVCGRTHSCFKRTPSYCPNCGAKMDLDSEQAET